jgi:hypothetical protein
MYWHQSWLPFMTQDAQRLYVDCDREVTLSEGTSPTRLVAHVWERFDVDRALSLAHTIEIWNYVLAYDYYRVINEAGNWEADWQAIPTHLRSTELV